MKSLDSDNSITIIARNSDVNRHFVFKMDHVQQCINDGMGPDRLLELGYQY